MPYLALAKGQYQTLVDLKKPTDEAELKDLWLAAGKKDKELFLQDNLDDIHDRKFLSLVLSKFVATDKDLSSQRKVHFALECAKEFGSQFVRNNIAAFEEFEKIAQGPWSREMSAVLKKAGIPVEIKVQHSGSMTFPEEQPNLRDSDIKTLFKMLPRDIKGALEEDQEHWLSAVNDALEKEKNKRLGTLRQRIKRGQFLDLRWGDDSLFHPGKTYLTIALENKPTGKLIKVFTGKGIQRVPLQWVRMIWPANLLGPVNSWDRMTPKLPEAHPANQNHWQERFKNGVFAPLHESISVEGSAQDIVKWRETVKPLLVKLDHLSEDQLLSCAAVLQENIQKNAQKLGDQFKSLVPGTWVESKDLGRVAYLGKADNGKARVWSPDEDAILDGDPEEFQKAIYRIPYTWIQKTLSEQAVRLDDNGFPSHADMLKHSNEFKRHHHGHERLDLVKGFEQRSLRKVSNGEDLQDWQEFWDQYGAMQSTVIKKRGEHLLQNFVHFASSDTALKNNSGKDSLKYHTRQPLKVFVVTELEQDGQHLGSYVRAEINLLEGTLVTKDPEIKTVFRE